MDERRPVVFGPGDKLLWLEAVATHWGSTDIDVRVGVAITNRLDKHAGNAVVGYGWIAEWIGRKPRAESAEQSTMLPKEPGYERKPGERSVQDSIARMKRNKLLAITAGGGRGKANIYQPLIDGLSKRHGPPWGKGDENDTAGRDVSRETSRQDARNVTANSHKHHGQPCTLPNTFPKNLPKGRESFAPSERDATKWTAVKQRLEDRLGRTTTIGVFGRVDIVQIYDREVMLAAPTGYVRSQIEQRYQAELHAAWVHEVGEPVSINIVCNEPFAMAAE